MTAANLLTRLAAVRRAPGSGPPSRVVSDDRRPSLSDWGGPAYDAYTAGRDLGLELPDSISREQVDYLLRLVVRYGSDVAAGYLSTRRPRR